jgi:rfaE bifunctional protein kinase chain/domain
MTHSRERLARIVRAFRLRTVGVLGDFMLDELLRGQATRISPEAPVPVVLMDGVAHAEKFPGGAGNVCANLAALGAKVIPFGAVGADEGGRELKELFRRNGIPCDTVLAEPGRTTPRKVRVVAHQQQLLRLDFERPEPLKGRAVGMLVRHFRRYAGRLDALVISDYLKGSVTTELCEKFSALARAHGVPVFVDPKPEHPETCRRATVITPNQREAEAMAGGPLSRPEQRVAAGRRLLEQFQCQSLLITRGGEGMTLIESPDGRLRVHDIPSVPRPVYDVTGAGDTVIAVMALAYSSGASLREAAHLANLAAGRVVLKFGTTGITAKELLQALREERLH